MFRYTRLDVLRTVYRVSARSQQHRAQFDAQAPHIRLTQRAGFAL
ncbi:MAG: hypothetical protein ABJF01_09465 [bacterium]